jgi:hypothetical protein
MRNFQKLEILVFLALGENGRISNRCAFVYIRVRGPAIIVTPIRSTAAAPAVARAHRFSLNSSQLEGYIRVSKPSNLTLLMKYIKTTTLLT